MNESKHLEEIMHRVEARLEQVSEQVEQLTRTRHKSMEWIGQLSEHIRSLDEFREEVRATFEPFVGKLDNLDEVMRILRHATSDVSRRVISLEHERERFHRAS